ncbi:MAG: hemolysin family protein [Limisphaerales bacterium]
MLEMPILTLVAFVVFGGASVFFALAETALFTLGKWQTRLLAERGAVEGRRVAALLAAPQDLLATIALGNTLTNAGVVITALWMVIRHDWNGWVALPLTLLGILVVGEIVPKTLAVRVPERWAVRVARPMGWLVQVTRPVRAVAQRLNAVLLRGLVPDSFKSATGTTEEDYAELLELAAQQGTLRQSEKEIILQIISLDRRTAGDVMTPRARMQSLSDDLPVPEMITAARRLKRSRLPLFDDSPDTIVGVLNTQTLLLNPEGDLSEAIEFPSFVPESINLLQLLKRLQRQRRGLAIVLDEFGGTAGVVTVEDILGSMIGKIRGEGDAEEFVIEKLGEGRWRVNGTMRIEDFRREYPELDSPPGVDTMGGLVVALAEVVPPQGVTVILGRLRLTARVADERRVREVLVEDSAIRRRAG